MTSPDPDIAAIAIGRNEGERLRRCLASLAPQVARVIYVDSGSTDGSVEAARAAGAEVVELDTTIPFTAARARNAGFEALRTNGSTPAYVQFVDGDCQVMPGWLEAARAELEASPELGLVTGWRSEAFPETSVYNAMCDVEWHQPAGEIETCGGDMMVRTEAFEATGGFNPTVIAAEDDEFCIRLRAGGWKIRRLPMEMTLHDANMTRFGQWWKRMERAGHGYAQVSQMHPGYFRRPKQRIWVWALILPFLFLAGLVLGLPWVSATVLALYALSWFRTSRYLTCDGLSGRDARVHAAFLTLSKFPELIGLMRFHRRRLRGDAMQLIEYK